MNPTTKHYSKELDLDVELTQRDDGGWRVIVYRGLARLMPDFDLSPYEPATAFAQALKQVKARLDRVNRRPLPEKPGSVITWRDGAYLPQIAQLDAGEMHLGWRYSDDTDAWWWKPEQLLARIGDAEWILLAPAEMAAADWIRDEAGA